MNEYIHDEWCDLDGTGQCSCYVKLLREKDAELQALREWGKKAVFEMRQCASVHGKEPLGHRLQLLIDEWESNQ